MTNSSNLTRMAGAGLRAAMSPSFRDWFPVDPEHPCVVDDKDVNAHHLALPNIGGGRFTDGGKIGKERRIFLDLIPVALHADYEMARKDGRFSQLILYFKNRGNGEGDEGILLGAGTNGKHYVLAVWDKNGHNKWTPPAGDVNTPLP